LIVTHGTIAFAGLQTRTPQAVLRASAVDGASQSILILLGTVEKQKGIVGQGLRTAPE
jgi:hypothetical protein